MCYIPYVTAQVLLRYDGHVETFDEPREQAIVVVAGKGVTSRNGISFVEGGLHDALAHLSRLEQQGLVESLFVDVEEDGCGLEVLLLEDGAWQLVRQGTLIE